MVLCKWRLACRRMTLFAVLYSLHRCRLPRSISPILFPYVSISCCLCPCPCLCWSACTRVYSSLTLLITSSYQWTLPVEGLNNSTEWLSWVVSAVADVARTGLGIAEIYASVEEAGRESGKEKEGARSWFQWWRNVNHSTADRKALKLVGAASISVIIVCSSIILITVCSLI